MGEAEWAAAREAMAKAGARDGKASASWLVDGNTTREQAETLLGQLDDGDPSAPTPPSPFSGEWADDRTLRDVVDAETDCDPDSLIDEELADLALAYTDAHDQAWYDEAERSARAILRE